MGIVKKTPCHLFDADVYHGRKNPDPPDWKTPLVHNKHHKTAPADAVYIGRGSPWGNPYVIGQHGTRDEVIELYRVNVLPKLDVSPLRGRHLVCFCKPAACHGDLLLKAANA